MANTSSKASGSRLGARQIVGVSLSPEMAKAFKTEAASRGMSVRKLFEEMWSAYKKASEGRK